MNTAPALARLAAHGLPGAPTDTITVDSLDALLVAADAAHVLAPVRAAVAAGAVADTGDTFVEQLDERARAAAAATLGAHVALAEAADRLTRAGAAPVIALKGCATAHLDHEAPHHRYSSDVDLLAPVAHHEAIRSANLGVAPVARRDRWDARYAKAFTVVDPHGVELDVHHCLVQGYFGLAIPDEDLTADLDSFVVAGRTVYALDAPGRLIHAALHAAGPGRSGLHSLRDIPQLVLVTGADWRDAVARAERWHVDALFAAGVRRAWEAFPLPPHPVVDWARHCAPRGRQKLALRLVGGIHGGDFLSGPLALPPQRWPGYLLPLVVPSRDYLRSRGTSWRRRLGSIIRAQHP